MDSKASVALFGSLLGGLAGAARAYSGVGRESATQNKVSLVALGAISGGVIGYLLPISCEEKPCPPAPPCPSSQVGEGGRIFSDCKPVPTGETDCLGADGKRYLIWQTPSGKLPGDAG